MDILCTVSIDILHIIQILIICKSFLIFKPRIKDKYRYIKTIIITIIISLIVNEIDNMTIKLIIYLLCVESVLIICYAEKIKKLLICGLWVSIVAEIIYMIAMSIMNTAGTLINYHNQQMEKLLATLLALIFIFIVNAILRRISKNGIRDISIQYLILFTLILIADLFMLTLMLEVTLEEMAYKNKVLYVVVYIAVVIGIFIQITAVILLLVSRNMYKEKEQIAGQYLEEQVKYYEYLEIKENETKKFRHDIRSHLYFLNKLKDEDKNKEFNEYLQDIIEKVDNLGNKINVGNDIVNAVLNKVYMEATSKNIAMKVKGHFPAKCNISAYNLCTIFYNLLNNAVEAADKATKREVWVICQYTDKEMIAEIGNYFCNDARLDKNKLITTKAEKEYHGWGIKNVEDSINDCGGLMDIEIDEDKFIVSLVLNNIL